jgi:hypothetical protein
MNERLAGDGLHDAPEFDVMHVANRTLVATALEEVVADGS